MITTAWKGWLANSAIVALVLLALLVTAKMLHVRRVISIGLKGEFGPATTQWQVEVMQQARRSQQIHGAVVFIGDSLIVGLATSNVAPKSENFGINGDTIDWLLLRLPQYNLTEAQAIVLEIGSNDWPSGFDGFASKYGRLLTMLPSQVPVIAVGLMPLNGVKAGVSDSSRVPDAFRRVNKEIALSCRQFHNCRYLDLFDTLADGSGNLKARYDAGDGQHLSTAGNDLWVVALKPLLNQETTVGTTSTP